MRTARPKIKVMANGPYRATGAPLVRMRPVVSPEGTRVEWQRGPTIDSETTVDICRCGQSGRMPFCDGTEERTGFDGTVVADRAPSQQRRREFGGGEGVLTDDRSLCARASFCVNGPVDVWELAEHISDPKRRALLLGMVSRCPSGRLVYETLPDRRPLEEELRPEIAVVEDGPLWIRGGIPIEGADGFEYEVRNRVTLCRCGQSGNKPFCDGSHVRVGFTDQPARQ